MNRFALPLLFLGAPASAHVGHVGELAGHDHWVAGIALGAAAAVTVWGVLKGKIDKDEAAQDLEDDTTSEEEETA